MHDLEFKCCIVKKLRMINIHEPKDIVKEQAQHAKQNKIDKVNKPSFMYLKRKIHKASAKIKNKIIYSRCFITKRLL